MINNTAEIAGHAIYGANFDRCYNDNMQFWDMVDIKDRNQASAISSLPRYACICSSDFQQTRNCTMRHTIEIFRGQSFNASLICVGQMKYSSSCIFRTETLISDATIAEESKAHKSKNKCSNFSYAIRIHSPKIVLFSIEIYPETKGIIEAPGYDSDGYTPLVIHDKH